MNRKNKIEILLIFLALGLSVLFGYLTQASYDNFHLSTIEKVETETSIIKQKIVETYKTPIKAKKMYYKNELIGIVNDEKYIKALIDEKYELNYKYEFPDTELWFKEDVYIVDYISYNKYENKDKELFDFAYDEELIAIRVPKVEFSSGDYIYVKNIKDFEEAKDIFVRSFVSENSYNKLKNNEAIEPLKTYGEQEIDLKIEESMKITEGYASIENIYLNQSDILNFLSFGSDPEYKEYVVEEFDMIDGIAVKNTLTINQLIAINKEIIKDESQIIKPGTKLNVTGFNSPFNVYVTKERKVEEIVHPAEIIYQKDPNLLQGTSRVEVQEAVGYRDATYEDVYLNDESIDTKLIKTKITKEPVRGIVKVGTYVEPRVGSGSFAWPMSGARISCGWGCYSGHQALDIQARTNRGYGPIYASDRGVITRNSYDGGYGYYVIINHNNGYETLYAHMNAPGYLPVGATVKKGQQIGYVGMTGRTTGPHVHFEIRRSGRKVNPCGFIGC